ncbi:MAG TPA: spore germination protein GerW family protein [Anaerolineae bacterium]|nr:spore germination protein GerW family protein [Anaerolineae bacterium]
MSEPTGLAQSLPPTEIEEVEADATTLFFESLVDAVGVETVFGDPIRADGRLIIPVAETSVGGGVGDVQYPRAEGGVERRELRLPLTSRGGGGSASTRPVAVVVVTPDDVRVQPIFDFNRIALAGMASAIGLWRGITAFAQAMRKRR